MGFLKEMKEKIYNSDLVKREYKKYCKDLENIPTMEIIAPAPVLQQNLVSENLLSEIHLYEKARTLIKDDIFTIQFEDTLIKFYLPSVTKDLIQKDIFTNDAFFEENLLKKMREYITPESIVLDAGTNIGNHTIFFSKICNAQKVYSFEPLKTVFSIFEKNLELNNIKNVEKFNLALGEMQGFASISGYNSTSVGSTQFEFTDNGSFEVISLDSLNIDKLDFAKVDVEGCQYELLKGARNTLEKCKPIIWIEMLDKQNAWFGYDEEHEVILPQKILEEMGYVLVEQMSNYDYLYTHKDNLKAGLK